MIRRKPRERWVLRRAEGLERVFNKLRGRGPLADDTETSGLRWHTDRVGAINLAANDVAVMCIEDALGPAARFVGDQIRERREFVFHHAKFDMHMQRETFGLHFPYPVHDTRISSFLLDNRGAPVDYYPFHMGHSLKPLANAYVDPDAIDLEKRLQDAIRRRGGGAGKENKANWTILLGTEDEHLVTEYGPMDAWYTLQLHLDFMERIRGWIQPGPQFQPLIDLYNTELWVLLALRDMEERGIKARRHFLEEWANNLRIEQKQAYQHLWKLANKKDVNWDSPVQVRNLLYGSRARGGLGLTTERMTKWDKKNPEKQPEYSTDKIALVLLGHPIGAALLNYRKITKELQEAEGILNHMRPDTNTIHPDFNQNVDTGRMSCRDPNMQNRKREGEMRRAFRARKRLAMRSADYTQVELRLAAHEAQEKALLNAFLKGEDPHTATALNMFGLTTVDSEQRTHGKTLNFAGIYGAGAPGIAEQLMAKMSAQEAYRACRKLGYRPSMSESPWLALAALLSQRHRRMMPAISRAAKRSEFYARRRGYAMNMKGRHRFFRPDEDEHVAFNTDIQGTAADIIKEAMAKIYRELQWKGGEVALLLQVHDELVYESDGNLRTDKRVKELMEDHHTYDVPIVADIKDVTKSWKDKNLIAGLT